MYRQSLALVHKALAARELVFSRVSEDGERTVAGRRAAGEERTNHERAGDARERGRAPRPFSDPVAHIRAPVPRNPSAPLVTALSTPRLHS